ncbi:MAG: TlpA family protein disulfide reductase [Nitrospinaceae bacterium]|nr:TlpA family protein disulfide reductase [Nitrospinaceae bacterium]MBT3435977.1 TlpA family protein disulfide reductase [Nitrospinaceae bacterium]MBT4094827.1 TlpA family protein disulfide reductase [Nitrospinaceae bacterium]MBT4431891.1 TlpA family protein disulfide reductase [Nitrospinaceae bacterium]MBT5369025.1 TlpA family protein disulfide reductase [Nitrospinaceae bacterium]
MYNKYKDQGFTILAISMDRNSSLVKPYVDKNKLTFPNLLDPSGKVSPIFNARYTPTNFLVNRAGQVIGGSLGYRDWGSPQGIHIIEALLAEAKPKESAAKN